MELKLNKNNYLFKITKKLDDIILEINELSNKSIIIITNKDINIFNRANHDFIIKEKYLIKDDWKMDNRSLTSR